ncbi:MAG: S-layer homology domain-containing protein [Clostridia bacterium]|nr:S-layer homology domain-containing protein [Clostridia bacterium]
MYLKKITALLLSATLLGCSVCLECSAEGFTKSRAYQPGLFTDVGEDAWYAGSVKSAYELGLMSGTATNAFSPAGMFTLAEAVTVAARMHNINSGADGKIPSAAGEWYQGAVNYCIENGIIEKGSFSDFTKNATRAQMVGILRAALPDSAWNAINDVKKLPDVNLVTPYSEDIFLMYNAGVISGSDEYGRFQPYAYITRAEVAAIVTRMADASARKTLNLTPMTETAAPVLSNSGKNFSEYDMSCGRLPVGDAKTGKWGYVDGTGAMVIPAIYDKVTKFNKNGYAIVYKDKMSGTIDINGNTLVPLNDSGYFNIRTYDSSALKWKEALVIDGRPVTPFNFADDYSYLFEADGVSYFRTYKSDFGYGIVDSKGKVIVPSEYAGVYSNGTHIWVTKDIESPHYDVYTLTGEKIKSMDYGVYLNMIAGNSLFRYQDGTKLGVASVEGKLTEAIYDDVILCDNSDFAIIKYGDMTGLVGTNGIIFDLGEYQVRDAYGKYAMLRNEENEVFFTDVNKNFTEKVRQSPSAYDGIFTVTDDIINYSVGNYYVYEIKTGETYKRANSSIVEWEKGFLLPDGQLCREYEYIDGCYCYKTADGLYGVYDKDDGTVTKAEYTSAEEAIKAYWLTLGNYSVRKENGKPIVVYDRYNSDEDDVVIRYYKNKIYYDEIISVGEGYFVCRFNETWYLVCA